MHVRLSGQRPCHCHSFCEYRPSNPVWSIRIPPVAQRQTTEETSNRSDRRKYTIKCSRIQQSHFYTESSRFFFGDKSSVCVVQVYRVGLILSHNVKISQDISYGINNKNAQHFGEISTKLSVLCWSSKSFFDNRAIEANGFVPFPARDPCINFWRVLRSEWIYLLTNSSLSINSCL